MPNNIDLTPPRRRFLSKVGQVGVALGAGMVGTGATLTTACQDGQNNQNHQSKTPPHPDSQKTHPFYGAHQAGITTPQQKHCYFLVMDLHDKQANFDKQQIAKLFKTWTQMADKLMQGKNVADYAKNPHLPPTDTGEADNLGAWSLTLTFGVADTFFDKLSINHKKPAGLAPLPKFPRDQLKPALTGGDLCIMACSDDPQVAFHAVRQLVRAGRSLVNLKYAQTGFVSFDDDNTPRNLFGFKDGTANRQTTPEDIWLDGDFANSTYLAVRTIAMHLETWDRTSLKAQEDTFLRHRQTGAPLGKTDEFAPLDTAAQGAEVAHSTLAKATNERMLRRAYSYNNGINQTTGQFDTGLLFLSFQKSPQAFIKIQNALGNQDKMTEYTTHIGSGLFWCFAGVQQGEFLGQALFE